MTIIPFPVGTYPVRVLQERATPMYQGCYALEQSNVVHIEALDPIDPSDCANVCSTYGSVNLGINAQFCTCFSSTPTITKTYDSSACSWSCDAPYDDYSCGGMDSSTLEDLYSYYIAFGSTTSASSGSFIPSSTASTSIRTTSVAVSFGQSSSLITAYPSSSVSFPKGSSSVDVSTVSVIASVTASSSSSSSSSSPFGISTTTPTPSSAPSMTGAIGPVATTVVLPVGVYFDISLSAWVGTEDSLYYWVSSPEDASSVLATIEAGAWIHLDPENPHYFSGFTLPILAGTTWFVHVTTEHPDNSASMFDIEIIVEGRLDSATTSPQVVSRPSASVGTSSKGRCRYQTTSSVSTTSAFATAAVPGGVHGFLNLGASTSSSTAVVATATATENTPVDTVQSLVSNDMLDIPLRQYLQNASVDSVDSWSVTPSIAGYNSDWILFDADNATLYGMVPSKSPNVTLLVTVAVASQSQKTTYFLSVKLNITAQRPASSSKSLFPLISLSSASTFATLPSVSRFGFTSKTSTFAGWNYTATSTSRAIVPTPFYNSTRSAWPSSQLSWNDTATNASSTALPDPYNFGNGVGKNLTATATTNSMPSFTITLWTTATAYYNPCPTCPLQATVVSIATGLTTIPVEVFKSDMPDNIPDTTVTMTETATESETSTMDIIDVVATLTSMVTVTTVVPSEETSSTKSSRSVTVLTSTVSSDFITGRTSAASLTGVSIWVLASTPVLVLLGVSLLL